jgi:hypothetical protein
MVELKKIEDAETSYHGPVRRVTTLPTKANELPSTACPNLKYPFPKTNHT